MENLFTEEKENVNKESPLAIRMRPQNLDEFVGQRHILGKDKLLRRAILADRISSLIFYGPPGTGKTALAYLIAHYTKSYFESINAVTTGVSELRQIIGLAKERKRQERKSILFIDELHRFNKVQQDALMGDIEEGTFILIGVTTHNPFFYLASPLLSRSQIFEFKPLKEEDLRIILKRALKDKERGLGNFNVEMEEESLNHIIKMSEGDGRKALNALELGVLTTPVKDGFIHFDLSVAEESIQRKALLYDRDENGHYETISAFIKSVRGSDVDASLYWLAKMLVAGEDPRFIARRLVILAAEDIGNADPQALLISVSAFQALEYVGMPEAKIPLSQATIYLAAAHKSNSAYKAIEAATELVEKERTMDVPDHLKPGSSRYLYPHNFSGHFVKQNYLLGKRKFYHPTEEGFEKEMGERLEKIEIRIKKEEIRKMALQRRNEEPLSEREKKSQKIKERLFSLLEFQKAETILFYLNKEEEVKTMEAIREARKMGKRVAVPFLNKREIIPSILEDEKKLVKGKFGILEPSNVILRHDRGICLPLIKVEDIDMVIVPGAAFDREGNRIGFGAGYYDRFLRRLSSEVPKIGLAFSFQILNDELPHTENDISVDKVITEEEIID